MGRSHQLTEVMGNGQTIDEEPEAASIPAPFEDVEEEGIEPLKTLLESLDEGRTTKPAILEEIVERRLI